MEGESAVTYRPEKARIKALMALMITDNEASALVISSNGERSLRSILTPYKFPPVFSPESCIPPNDQTLAGKAIVL